MYKEDLASNNMQWLMYHKTQPNHQNQLEGNLSGTKTKRQNDQRKD